MDWTINVAVHESVTPRFARERIRGRLKRGEVDPALLYSGLRQTLKWIELHRAYSPARRDPDCQEMYRAAFATMASRARGNVAHVISLGCGDGSKDLILLEMLRASGRTVLYTPVDVSLEMALAAHQNICAAMRGLQCTPLLCDLPCCPVLPAILKSFDPAGAQRFILFLGMMQNHWPPEVLRPALHLLRAQDEWLASANLAPAGEYEAALRRILEQYDNPPTRDWLLGALSELDLRSGDGELRFDLAAAAERPDLKRIEARFVPAREKRLDFFGEEIAFRVGEPLRVFQSYRFTREHARGFLEGAGLSIRQEWINRSEEEGVFLCERAEAVGKA